MAITTYYAKFKVLRNTWEVPGSIRVNHEGPEGGAPQGACFQKFANQIINCNAREGNEWVRDKESAPNAPTNYNKDRWARRADLILIEEYDHDPDDDKPPVPPPSNALVISLAPELQALVQKVVDWLVKR